MFRKREKPEIILKLQFEVDATTDMSVAVPEVLLLANRAGFKRLAKYFNNLAKRLRPSADGGDPDDHQHLPDIWEHAEEINHELSDRIAFRLGILSVENREHALGKYGISKDAAAQGCLTERFPILIEEARGWLR